MVVQYASPSDIAILGEEVITKIAYSDTFIYSRGDDNRQKRIGLAARYAALANKKMASTIPYFSVDVDGFTVSRYSSCEPDVLACGIDTDSCFRIFGNDNDFLLYTLFNKNGIVIKITDEFGNLVGRSSGFRNGNVLYFNQARTIYDTHGSPTKETNEVMQKYHKALEVFAKKIISLTADSSQPIEHVIVLKTYGYNEVDGATYIEKEMIPYIPMNIKGKDYQEFLDDPDLSLSSANNKEGFTTDYQGAVYDAVVLASAPGKEIQSKSDIIGYDASAIYYRPRKKVMVYKKGQIDFEVVNSINRIIAKNIYWGNNDIRNEKKKNFKLIKSLEDIELVILGEDYYFMMDSFGNTHELCLPYDKRAISEFEEVKKAVIGNYRTLR